MKTLPLRTRLRIFTLGCSKNLVDSEHLMAQLAANGIQLVEDDNYDAVVINTCGFIADAKEESIESILQAVEDKKSGFLNHVYVMGCLSQRYKKDLQEELPLVDGFYGARDHDIIDIAKDISGTYRYELVGERKITTPSHYAYLKISEGCDRSCTFCAIPGIRGRQISQPIERLVQEAEGLANQGVKELIVIAQDLTAYGTDLYGKRNLATLLRHLARVKGIEWIRLHYAYPHPFPRDILKVMAEEPKIVKYMDIPLQHISNPILKSMRRGHTAEQTKQLLIDMRQAMPDMAIRTTFIVGYPGETEADFEDLKAFVKWAKFERLGVFTYSPEEDTPADALADDVPETVKEQRKDELMALQADISYQLNRNKIGKVLQVIIDRKEGNYFVGRTQYDSPEVDNEVLIPQEEDLTIGRFYDVKITEADSFELYACLTEQK